MTSLLATIGSVFQSRATPENPQFDLNSPEAWDAFGASKSAAGVRVGRKEALKYAAMWRGINLISDLLAKVDLYVYKREGEGWTIDRNHAAYQVVHRKPNPFMSPFYFKKTVQSHGIMGNGRAYVFRDGGGGPLELLPLLPDQTHTVRANGKKWHVTTVKGEQRRLPDEDVVHIKGLGYDGLEGHDLIEYMRETLGLGIAKRDYGARFFSNDATPGMVLSTPAKMSPEAAKQMRDDFERLHMGLENAHRVAILHHDTKPMKLSNSAKESQLAELTALDIRDIANFLGLPPHKLGDSAKASYNSLEQENQSLLDDCLDPWLTQWEEELSDKLLTEEEKANDSHWIEFDREALVRADLAARTAYHSEATGGRAWETPDEARAAFGRNPLGGDAATLKDPANIMGKEEPKPDDEPEPDDDEPTPEVDEDDERQRALVAECAGRMVRRLGTTVRRLSNKPDRLLEWIDEEMETKHRDTISGALTLVKAPADATERLFDEVRRLVDGLKSDGFGAAVRDRMTKLETEWPQAVAAKGA